MTNLEHLQSCNIFDFAQFILQERERIITDMINVFDEKYGTIFKKSALTPELREKAYNNMLEWLQAEYKPF